MKPCMQGCRPPLCRIAPAANFQIGRFGAMFQWLRDGLEFIPSVVPDDTGRTVLSKRKARKQIC